MCFSYFSKASSATCNTFSIFPLKGGIFLFGGLSTSYLAWHCDKILIGTIIPKFKLWNLYAVFFNSYLETWELIGSNFWNPL